MAITEASLRFALPAHWIRAVMRAESGGDPHAVSVKGAMGLMQLMPPTWHELRSQLGLGSDPFDVRDNVMAGAIYLRQLLDRFGPHGFLAAYHAGPGRYAQHVSDGRPLPLETRAYVAGLAPKLRLQSPSISVAESQLAPDWRRSGLFVGRASDRGPPAATPLFSSHVGEEAR